MEKTKRKYKRRNFSDKEIQAEFDKWYYASGNRGIDQNFTRWLTTSEQGFASVDGFSPVMERLAWPQRCQAIEDCKRAAELTMPAHSPMGFNQRYTNHAMFAALSLKLLLETTYRGVISHFEREFPERYLTFERLFTLPSFCALYRFDANLSDETWNRFLSNLSPLNSGLALLLESRRECKRT